MKIFNRLSVIVMAAAFTVGVMSVFNVSAQNTTKQDGGSGLQISPTRTEISSQPGESKNFSINLKNVTQGDLKAKGFINDFESDNVSGTPKLIVDETKEKNPFSIKSMIKAPEDIILKAGETKQVNFTVDIPGGVAPGAYFGAVRYAAIPDGQLNTEDERKVALTASVAHLVFVEIPGDVVEKIQIEKVIPVNSDGKKSSIFSKSVKSSVTIKNLGNGFSRPFGKVTLNRGSKTVSSYDFNNTDPRSIVLPQSTRNFTDDLSGVKTPGKYKISAGVAYGNGGEVVNYETSFWYLPLWFVGVLALVLIALVVAGWYGYRRVSSGGASKPNKKS